MEKLGTLLAFMLLTTAGATAWADPVTTLADIDFWVGQGQNEAALVIDFDDMDATTPSLVWGYRFDGSPTAETMFRDITAGDPRLYAKISTFSFGNLVNGIGFDANDDGLFALDDGTIFGTDGIFESAGTSDGAMSLDSGDLYREGFFTDGFWNLGEASTSPFDGGSWTSAMVGLSDLVVGDEMFLGLTFDSDFSSFTGTGDFPMNPQAAQAQGTTSVPEPSSLAAMVLCFASLLFGYRLTRRRAV